LFLDNGLKLVAENNIFSKPCNSNVIKLSNKLPLLLERAGVRKIETKAKYFILIPLILTFSRREKGLFA
jgi:hypothetical protein